VVIKYTRELAGFSGFSARDFIANGDSTALAVLNNVPFVSV
jgi:hypothetical protein